MSGRDSISNQRDFCSIRKTQTSLPFIGRFEEHLGTQSCRSEYNATAYRAIKDTKARYQLPESDGPQCSQIVVYSHMNENNSFWDN